MPEILPYSIMCHTHSCILYRRYKTAISNKISILPYHPVAGHVLQAFDNVGHRHAVFGVNTEMHHIWLLLLPLSFTHRFVDVHH